MIAASLVLVLALNSALLPLDTALVPQAADPRQSVTDSEVRQPTRLDATRFDSVTAETLRAILDTASAHGIPLQPLISLAYQGTAWRKPGSQISNKVRAQYFAMVDARVALGDASTPSELASGGDALRAGVDGKILVAIRASRPGAGSAVNALVVLNDLMNRGIQSGRAGDAVAALARASKSDDKLNALQQLVAKNADRGPGMAQAALDGYLRRNVPGTASSPPKPVTPPPGPPDAQ